MYCPKCGTQLSDHAKFCSKCGAMLKAPAQAPAAPQPAPQAPAQTPQTPVTQQRPQAPVQEPVTQQRPQAPIQPKPQAVSPAETPSPAPKKKSKAPLIIALVAVFVLLAALAVWWFFLRGGGSLDPSIEIEQITLAQTEITMKPGETYQVEYTISPQEAEGELKWESSDEFVAQVDDKGCITALESGDCTVTVNADSGAKAKLTVRVELSSDAIPESLIGTFLYMDSDEGYYAQYIFWQDGTFAFNMGELSSGNGIDEDYGTGYFAVNGDALTLYFAGEDGSVSETIEYRFSFSGSTLVLEFDDHGTAEYYSYQRMDENASKEPTQETEPVENANAYGIVGKVALVTDGGSITDQGYNQACWEAIEQWCNDNYADCAYYQSYDYSTDALIASVEQAVAEGANVIVSPTYLFGEAIIECQDRYSDVYFIGVDLSSFDLTHDYVTYYEPSYNTLCMTFAEEQAGYLAGYAAVKDGYTKLGFLGAMPIPVVIRYGYGFVQGADAAAAEMDITVDIKYTYSDRFYGTPETTTMMQSWYLNGTEVIFACGGGIYTSAVEAANACDGKVIGLDVDQSWVDGCIITSAMKELGNSVKYALDTLGTDNWGSVGGKSLTLSLTDGDYLGLPTAEGSWRFSRFTQSEYEAVKAEIMDGTRKVDNSSDDSVKPVTSNANVDYVDFN